MDDIMLVNEHKKIWDQLVAATRDRNHGFHTFTLATVDNSGLPQARTMVLRRVDQESYTLRFNADARSPKVAEIRQNPVVCAVFYDAASKLQIRARGNVFLHSTDPVTADTWQKMQRMSRDCYRTPDAPSSSREFTVNPRELLTLADGYENLVVCDLSLFALEWLSLSSAGHARARHDYGNEGIISSRWLHP